MKAIMFHTRGYNLRFLMMTFMIFACCEKYNLRIDTNCTEDQRADILSAIEEVNAAWYECHDDDGIRVTGNVEIRTYNYVAWPKSTTDDADDWVVCVPAGERILLGYPDTTDGLAAHGGNVIIFTSQLPRPENFRRVVLHELGHYIDLPHKGDPADVMYGDGVLVEHLSATDRRRICDL